VTKLNAAGSALVYSTYLGGSNSSDASLPGDAGNGIAIDDAGNAYVAGYTLSSDFPTTPGAFQTTCGNPCAEAFVAKLYSAAATMTALLPSSLNPSIYGQAVTFTAAVSSGIGAPPDGETVLFMRGKTALGTGTLSGSSASFTISSLPTGNDSITAVYGSDANFAVSTSNVVQQVVNKATTTIALTSSPNPSSVGHYVTFTASVSPEFSGKVTGPVTLLRWHVGVGDCGPERRDGKVQNLEADAGHAQHHGYVQRQRQL
jgi:hypothetical protein